MLCVLLCMVMMFRVKREYKAALMLISYMLFSTVSLDFLPLKSANSLITLAFLVSEYKNFRMYFSRLRFTIITKVLSVMCLLWIIMIINSPHLHSLREILLFIDSQVMCKYLVLAYAFCSFDSENSIKPTINLSIIALIIITLLGIENYYSKVASFVVANTEGTTMSVGGMDYQIGELYAGRDRFRVAATFANPFDYGYMCVTLLLLHIFAFIKRIEKRGAFVIALICCSFGIVMCGCRTIIFCALISFLIYMAFAFKLKKSINILISLICLLVISYIFVPSINENIDNMLSMFDNKSEVNGSSIEMRSIQYAAVLYHVQDSPLFGNGYRYFSIDLGWQDGPDGLLDERLAGLEGVALSYVLERGFIGLILWIIFNMKLAKYCYSSRKSYKMIAALGLSVLTLYLAFSNMTGELMSVMPTMFVLGYVVRVNEINKQGV